MYLSKIYVNVRNGGSFRKLDKVALHGLPCHKRVP